MNPSEIIYLDHAATTPVDPRVVEVMLPYFNTNYGNPSSVHMLGQQAEITVETARSRAAAILNCFPDEILFTSGGSESDNLALRGAAISERQKRGANHILISPVEHDAVQRTAEQLKTVYGFALEYLPVDRYGRVDPSDLSEKIRADTAVVSIIHGNNVIGTINPIPELGAVCRERSVPFHSDAVQSAAHLHLDLKTMNVDMISIGAHKFYGPKGVGVLYRRKGIHLIPSQTGGSQEYNLRSGTENVPLIWGLVEALRIAQKEVEERNSRLIPLRDLTIERVLNTIPDAVLTGHPQERLPNHASFAFLDVDANTLLMLLDAEGFACSSGSACKTGLPEPSGVLLAIGLEREWALGSLRISLGKDTSQEEIESFLDRLPEVISKVRALQKGM
jgi:cysteine desulfurase